MISEILFDESENEYINAPGLSGCPLQMFNIPTIIEGLPHKSIKAQKTDL